MFARLNGDYIDSWSEFEIAGHVFVKDPSSLFGKLGCVKIENGIAVLDKAKEDELIVESQKPDEIDQLKKQIAQQGFQIMQLINQNKNGGAA